jgi:hypothetical protein
MRSKVRADLSFEEVLVHLARRAVHEADAPVGEVDAKVEDSSRTNAFASALVCASVKRPRDADRRAPGRACREARRGRLTITTCPQNLFPATRASACLIAEDAATPQFKQSH